MTSGIVRFSINDQPVWCGPPVDETLLTTLRDRLGYMDVKSGCREGACGACTVILNGRAVPSCLILTATVDGGSIFTWTGIMNEPLVRELSSRLHMSHAFQCGFCETGILTHLFAVLSANPNPTADDMKDIIDSHVCRCGGYRLMIETIREFPVSRE